MKSTQAKRSRRNPEDMWDHGARDRDHVWWGVGFPWPPVTLQVRCSCVTWGHHLLHALTQFLLPPRLLLQHQHLVTSAFWSVSKHIRLVSTKSFLIDTLSPPGPGIVSSCFFNVFNMSFIWLYTFCHSDLSLKVISLIGFLLLVKMKLQRLDLSSQLEQSKKKLS